MSSNGEVASFTKAPPSFEIEGHTFQTRKIDPADWAETLKQVAVDEDTALNAATSDDAEEKQSARPVLAVSAEGIEKLILLAIVDEQHAEWQELRASKSIDFGQLDAIRQFLWEKMTERPFSSPKPSGDGPGANARSSRGRSPSQEVVRGG